MIKFHECVQLDDLVTVVDGIEYTERWADIAGWEGLYQISDFGRIKSLKRDVLSKNNQIRPFKLKIVRGRYDKDGYRVTSFYKNNKEYPQKNHRLVGSAFILNSNNKPLVNHIDGTKDNNFYKNLEWATESENQRHAYRVLGVKIHTIGKTGGLNPRAKRVTCSTLGVDFDCILEAARFFGMSKAYISAICKNKIVHVNGLVFRYLN